MSDRALNAIGGVLVTAIVTTVVAQPTTPKVIRAMGDAYAGSIRAALGTSYTAPTKEETRDEWIARVEHELMIDGHQMDCAECQRPRTLREKWLSLRG